MRPVALVFLAIITLAALACTGGQPTPAPTSGSTTAPTVEATVMVATEARTTSEALAPTGKTAVDLPAKTPATEPSDVSTPTLTAAMGSTSTPQPAAIPTPIPTPTPQPPATSTPKPTPTAMPSPTPSPTATPTPTPMPESATDPALTGYAPLLKEAVAEMDFVRDGLNAEEKNILGWADSRLFSNPAFQASKWGPDNWPSDVKTASVRAIPLLMLEIDIEKRSDGKHVVTWGVDSLDRILDDLGIHEGVCVSCYGKDNYASVDEVRKNQYPIVNDQKHVHREMLKTFAYFAEADGEGILMRSLMENDADDFEMLYRRVLPVERMFTDTSFGWQNQSFMSQIRLPDGTFESFPTTVYKAIGNAATQRESAERWFGHINRELVHFTGGTAEFANLFRPYSQTPYTPEPGYILLVGEAGSPSSTGLTVSAFRSIGLKVEQFLSPAKGRRTGAVEIDGEWFYHNGNMPLTRNIVDPCLFFQTLEAVEAISYDLSCAE